MERLKNKIVVLGFIEKGTGKHMSNSVYSKNGIAPTIMASLGVKQPGIFFVVEDKNGRSSEVQKFRSSEVQKFRSSEDCTDSTKLVKPYRYKNIPARLDKISGHENKKGSEFAAADEHRIMNVNDDVSSTVTARYYKGLSAHGDNLVIVKVLYE